MIIYKQFTFDSAHFLPNVAENHKCKKLHGHTYWLTIYVEGKVLKDEGWIMDFTDLKKIAAPVIAIIDHALLNDIEGLENPTAENLAVWLWKKLKPSLASLVKIELKETPSSGVIYTGD